jgi:hypothetical protein
VLFAIRAENEKPRIFAFPADQIPPLALGDEELHLIAYPLPLDRLGLTAGAQPQPSDTDPARPLPPGFVAYRSDETRESWTMISADDLTAALGTRVLADVVECEVMSGCIRRSEELGLQYCELPCDEPPDPMFPQEPTPPSLPDFGACPSGWVTRQSLALDASYCEPPDTASCPAGSAHFTGDAQCDRIGAACPADGWPSLPGGRTVHFVRAGGAGDGTSKAAPFGTIQQAIAAAGPLDIIALYAGDHAGGVVVDRAVELRGACSETTISGGSPALVVDADVSLFDLTVVPAGDGIDVRGNALLQGVTIDGAARGIVISGSLVARELVVQASREGGLIATGTGDVRVQRAVFTENVSHGIRVGGQAIARLEDIAVRGSMRHASGAFDRRGYGALADAGRMVITRGLFERNRGNAIATWYSATSSVTYAVDRDGLGGYSFDLDNGAFGEISYLVTLRASSGSVWTFRTGHAVAKNLYVQASGGGLFARSGGRLEAERVLLEANSGVGIESSGAGNVSLRDVSLRDQSMTGANTGLGILIDDASLDANRIQILRATGQGIDVRGSPETQAAATLENLRVSDVQPRSADSLSYNCLGDASGLRVRADSSLMLDRAVFEGGARGIGIDSYDQQTIRHVLIRGAKRTGLCATNGTYSVENLWIEDTTGLGIYLFGGYMETTNLAVLGTKRIESDEESGVGVVLAGRNTIMDVRIAVFPVTTFSIAGNEARGLQMENGSQAMLQDGEIAGSDIAIDLVNQPGFDLASLYTNVIFRNNATVVRFR